jgi:hypothetical protein
VQQNYRAELSAASMLLTTWFCVTEALHLSQRVKMKSALMCGISADTGWRAARHS